MLAKIQAGERHPMKYIISPEGESLTIHSDGADLSECRDIYEAMESLIANSELQWINPADTGDLTEAPMLGILGNIQSKKTGPFGAVHVGLWDNTEWYQPVLMRWAFMRYQIEDPLEVLRASGSLTFTA